MQNKTNLFSSFFSLLIPHTRFLTFIVLLLLLLQLCMAGEKLLLILWWMLYPIYLYKLVGRNSDIMWMCCLHCLQNEWRSHIHTMPACEWARERKCSHINTNTIISFAIIWEGCFQISFRTIMYQGRKEDTLKKFWCGCGLYFDLAYV